MDRKTFVGAIVLITLIVSAGCFKSKPTITVGSKDFTEQVVLGEIIAQHIERRLGQPVGRRLNLGGTLLTYQGLLMKNIDLYPEYTGTIISAVLKETPDKDPTVSYERARAELQRVSNLVLLRPLGINNVFAMIVRGDDAREKKLEKLSDAENYAWNLGVGPEFQDRKDGYAALSSKYSLPLKTPPRTMNLGLLYQALEERQVNMAAGNETDGLLAAKDFKVLEDDRKAFPSYQACIMVRQDTLQANPQLRAALDELTGKFTNEVMRKLNWEVDARHRQPKEVAAQFLQQAGLQ